MAHRDVNADDYIGTFYLHMSEISSLADNGMGTLLYFTLITSDVLIHKVSYRLLDPASSTAMVLHESSVSFRISMNTSTRDW